ncbi:MAG: hypothetical protein ACRENP_02620 [Longimicrobiales bacterium]
MRRPRHTVARGAIAGILGALALAVWFLLIDTIEGQPLRTPAFIASAVLGRDLVIPTGGLIALYTIIHFVAFIILGLGVTWLLERSETPPHFLLGMVLGFLLFDLVFYMGVVVTGVDVVRALGWPEVLVGNLIAGVALMAYLHATGPGTVVSWRDVLREHRIIREGLIAGVVGAVVVAAWFLVIDLVQGRVLFTPAALGSAVFLGARSAADIQVNVPMVLAYTGIHLAAFLGTGFIASALISEAEKDPPMLLGLVLLFVTFEVLFFGLIAIMASWLLDSIRWWTILVANLVAAFAMGWYLWKAHPNLQAELSKPLEDEEIDLEDAGAVNRTA